MITLMVKMLILLLVLAATAILLGACGGKAARPEITLVSVVVGRETTLTDRQPPKLIHEIIATIRIHNPNDFPIVTETKGRGLPSVSGIVVNIPPSDPSIYDLRVEPGGTIVLEEAVGQASRGGRDRYSGRPAC